MIHPNPFISAFLSVPEWSWKNDLRRWLAFSPFVPDFIQNYSPLKGYERVHPLRQGDVVLDAGAYPGDYTLYAARSIGPAGKVFALEPDPENRKILENHVKKSGFQNIEILPVGLWNTSTSLSLDSKGVASSLHPQDGNTVIPVTTLDQLLPDLNLERIDVLKMDIEGAELQALEGARRALAGCRAVHVASYHLVDGEPTASRVERILQDSGFIVETGYKKHLTTTGVRDIE